MEKLRKPKDFSEMINYALLTNKDKTKARLEIEMIRTMRF
jgi:hypothetical protein